MSKRKSHHEPCVPCLAPPYKPGEHSRSLVPLKWGSMASSSDFSSPALPKVEPEDSPSLKDIPSPKRVCISNACQPCRKRKTKCDGVKPACNSCASVYNTAADCVYDLNLDLRRKDAMIQRIRELSRKLEDLTTIYDAQKNGSETDADNVLQWIRNKPEEPYELLADAIKTNSIAVLEKSSRQTLDGELVASKDINLEFEDICPWAVDQVPTADQTQTWTQATNDRELIMHLLQLYFTYSHSFYVLFSEELFWHGLGTMKLKYNSPVLLNAVLALACNFSDRPEARANTDDPTTIGDHFFEEAKRLLNETPRSCVTNVQALGLMSLRQAMRNEDSIDSSWGYRARMTMMALELGLHMESTGPRNSNITSTEAEFRRITFWGCFVLDTALAICSRPISPLQRTAIQLEKPNPREDEKQDTWKPYDVEGPFALAQPRVTYNLLHQLGCLSEIVSDIAQMFYAQGDDISDRKLQRHYDKLQQWHGNLPEALAVRIDGPTLPQVLNLHIYYHYCVIRLFLRDIRSTTSIIKGTHVPRQICLEEAIAMFQLMMTYSKTYGLKRGYLITTHCIAISAIIHLLHMSSLEQSLLIAVQAADMLLETIKMMRDMQATFPNIAGYLRTIRGLASKWAVRLSDPILQALELSNVPTLPLTNPVISPAVLSPSPANNEPPSPAMENDNHAMDFGFLLDEDELDDLVGFDAQYFVDF